MGLGSYLDITVKEADGDRMPRSSIYNRILKRVLDFIIAIILLTVLFIPMLLIALAIRLDSPGSPLFLQRRIGLGGREFTMWKFRTMAHSSADELVYFSTVDGRKQHKVKNDPRITQLGRFLRKTSLDELPQLVNVMLGQMSLVGPRPELLPIVAQYEPWQHERHAVRPGITGWWQVSGRSELPMHENTQLDIYYVKNLSFWLDIKILFKTVRGVARGLGAF